VASAEVDSEGRLIITLTNGVIYQSESLQGPKGTPGAYAGECSDGQGLVFDAAQGQFACANLYDKDEDGTLVWEDCDDRDPALNNQDADGDGISTCQGDCQDDDASIHPGRSEVCANDIDENCDTIIEPATFCEEVYVGAAQTIYLMPAQTMPDTGAASWYQDICKQAGLHPVSCDPATWGPEYDASAFGAVALDAAHYGCNVSNGVKQWTEWESVLSFHLPESDQLGVCQNGCAIDGQPVHPLCTP